jgi:hypothetical protein
MPFPIAIPVPSGTKKEKPAALARCGQFQSLWQTAIHSPINCMAL